MKKYQDEAAMAIHEVAEAMNKVGIIPDERMRGFDESCLVKPAATVPRVTRQKPPVAVRSGAPVYAQGK